MPSDWRKAYEAAIGELDPAKIRDRCSVARRAIVDRVIELATADKVNESAATEGEELREASAI
jgi:hypothetical protein